MELYFDWNLLIFQQGNLKKDYIWFFFFSFSAYANCYITGLVDVLLIDIENEPGELRSNPR